MPIQVYECDEDGEFDLKISFKEDIPQSMKCPVCNEKIKHIISAPSIKIVRGWNEKANEYQRDPYTQAKAQAWNVYNENREHGHEAIKPTEGGIQIAAREIAKHPTPKDVGPHIDDLRRD